MATVAFTAWVARALQRRAGAANATPPLPAPQPGPAVDAAPPSPGTDQNAPVPPAAAARVLDELTQARRRVQAQSDFVRKLTESEVLACGGVLSELLDKVNDTLDRSRQLAERNAEQLSALSAGFAAQITAELASQQGAVSQLGEMTARIEAALASITQLNQMANLLAINARIESAHLGDRGKSFTAIADRMRELSTTINDMAGTVGQAMQDMRGSLPPIVACGASMQRHAEAFIADTTAITAKAPGHGRSDPDDSGSDAGPDLSVLADLSNQALSHLQFQDPVVQRVNSIPLEFDQLEDRIQRLMNGETDLPPAQELQDHAEDDVATGVMMLF